MTSWNKNTFRKGLRIVLVSLLLYAVVSFTVTKIVYDACFPRYEAAASAPATGEEVTFLSGGNRLTGRYFGGEEQALVVIAPGFNARLEDYAATVGALHERGWDVLIYDPTGSGGSEGTSAVGFPQALLDLDAALTFAEETYDYDEVFLLGHSGGGWAACGMLESGHAVAGVVAVSALNSPMEATLAPATRVVGPLAYGNYPFLWLYQSMLFGSGAVDVRADEAVNASSVPVLIVQGSGDDVAPAEAFSLYSHREDVRTDGVAYLLCDGAGQDGHTDLLFDPDGSANGALMDEIDRFFRENYRK
ncbi:MAG: alpha/beta fold hydrolase [Clostridia bacterium]|nr:alpha/beta fold hydrolase [Clostridia bacterium]